MRSVNKVILIGNLTRDPELKQTPGGQNIVTFGMATNREWVTKDGRKNNLAEFHDVVAWANLAEICHKYLKKGKLVYVEGYLKTRSWDLPDGTKKFRTEIVVQDMIMLDKRPGGESYGDIDSEDGEESTGDYMPEEYVETEETPAPAARKEKAVHTKTAEAGEKHAAPKEKRTAPEEKSEAVNPADVSIDTDLGL